MYRLVLVVLCNSTVFGAQQICAYRVAGKFCKVLNLVV